MVFYLVISKILSKIAFFTELFREQRAMTVGRRLVETHWKGSFVSKTERKSIADLNIPN